jgi:hypothetical protein
MYLVQIILTVNIIRYCLDSDLLTDPLCTMPSTHVNIPTSVIPDSCTHMRFKFELGSLTSSAQRSHSMRCVCGIDFTARFSRNLFIVSLMSVRDQKKSVISATDGRRSNSLDQHCCATRWMPSSTPVNWENGATPRIFAPITAISVLRL